ncbi:MAG: RNA helicase [Sanya Nora-like virus]|nr:MAG: RNA helicase [Sanya Nora-like virus]
MSNTPILTWRGDVVPALRDSMYSLQQSFVGVFYELCCGMITKRGAVFICLVIGCLLTWFGNLNMILLGGVLITYALSSWFKLTLTDTIIEPCVKHLANSLHSLGSTAVDKMIDALRSKPIGFNMIAANFWAHKIGVAASVRQVSKANDIEDVVLAATNLGSHLGFEDSIFARFSSKVAQVTIKDGNLLNQGMEDAIPLLGTVMTVVGKEVTDLDCTQFLDRQAKSIKSIETITEHLKKVVVASGLVKEKNYTIIMESTRKIAEIREDVVNMRIMLKTNANDLLTPAKQKRLEEIKTICQEVDRELKLVANKKMSASTSIQDIRLVTSQVYDLVEQVACIKAGFALRQVPVGVCIQGDRQIGKSHLSSTIIDKVKVKLARDDRYKDMYMDPTKWNIWYVQKREANYDEGYYGQEITLDDDAFQNKDNEDHKKWINFISPNPVGTVQADLKHKGMPFTSKLCVASCNQFPMGSITIECTEALQERFPVTVLVERNDQPMPTTGYDDSYSWLDLRVGTMAQCIKWKGNLGIRPQPSSVDDIVEMICEKIRISYDRYVEQLACKQALYNQSTDEDDNEEEDPTQVLREVEDWLDENDQYLDIDENLTLVERVTLKAERFKTQYQQWIKTAPKKAVSRAKVKFRQIKQNSANWLKEVWYFLNDDPEPNTELSTEVHFALRYLSIAEISSAVNRFPKLVHDQMRKAKFEPISSIGELGDWVACLRTRHGKKDLLTIFTEEEKSLSEFLAEFGSYEVIPEFQEDFNKAWANQKIVCYHDDTIGCRVYWGPLIMGGSTKVPESPEIERILQDDMSTGPTLLMRIIQAGIIGAAAPISGGLLGCASLMVATHTVEMLPWRVVERFSLRADRRHWRAAAQGAEERLLRNRNVLERVRMSMTRAVIDPLGAIFDRIQLLADKISHYAVRTVITILEYFGVQVEPFWKQVLEITFDTVTLTAIYAIALMLIVIVYKWITKSTPEKEKETPKPVQRLGMHSKGEVRASRKKAVQARRIVRDKLKVQNETPSVETEKVETCWWKNEYVNYFEFDPEDDISYQSLDLTFEAGTTQGSLTYGYIKDEVQFTEPPKDTIVAYGSESAKIKLEGQDREMKTLWLEAQYICSTEAEIEDRVTNITKIFGEDKSTQICVELHIHRHSDTLYWIKVFAESQLTNINGTVSLYTRANLKELKSKIEELKGHPKVDISSIVLSNHSTQGAVDVVKSITISNLVRCGVPINKDFDVMMDLRMFYGIGHRNVVFTMAHAVHNITLIRVWRNSCYTDHEKTFHVAKKIYHNTERDLAVFEILPYEEARILSHSYRVDKTQLNFSNIEKHLLYDSQWLDACLNNRTVSYLPKTKTYVWGEITYHGSSSYVDDTNDKSEDVTRNYLKITLLTNNVGASQRGDCGGPIVLGNGKHSQHLVGFHAGVVGSSAFVGVILTREDIREVTSLVNHNELPIDPWEALIIKPGSPDDLPNGDECEFVGNFAVRTLPATSTSLDHWFKSPFADQFEEKLAPGALSARDERIKVDLPKNRLGEPSLLLTPNSLMCQKLPPVNLDILKKCEEEFGKYLSAKLKGKLERVDDNLVDMLHTGLNGRPHWQFVHAMEVNKAAGIPWSYMKAPKKADLIDVDSDGVRTFKNDTLGKALKNRVIDRLLNMREGRRLISFSNSKLKDTTVKLQHVENGKTRVFHCISVECIITDAILFGPFKEAFTKLGLDGFHGIGINPHSMQWKELYDRLRKFPNAFDQDFKHFDKYQQAVFMRAAFNIIRRCVNENAEDEWDQARDVACDENIETYVVDYGTTYKTKRSMKSGSYLTTVVNCIVNFLYDLYTWFTKRPDSSITEFLQHNYTVKLGDDGDTSVDDEASEDMNYFTHKEVLTSFGQVITPGAKDGIERKFTPWSQLTFCKRSFKEEYGVVLAPLEQSSIESPFVWTNTEPHEYSIWCNLIEQQLDEALLHGKEYYDTFVSKLGKCNNEILLQKISPLLLETFDQRMLRYLKKYRGT